MTKEDIIYACFYGMIGDPDYEYLVLLTYDEEQAKRWAAEEPQNTKGKGRYYEPWKVGVIDG